MVACGTPERIAAGPASALAPLLARRLRHLQVPSHPPDARRHEALAGD